MLTKGDDYPIHQTPEPVATAGTDRNFYDRYFFNGSLPDGDGFFALAFGVYPHLNVADAHFSVLRGGVQTCLHASRILHSERMDLSVGPIAIEVIEPLKRLRLTVAGQDGVSADLVCEGRAFPIEEPRFQLRNGPRTIMDVTRMTQTVRWSGWVEVDGVRQTYGAGAVGVRDRSWGVRPIGAADPQPAVPLSLPQFYWLWAPTNFPNLSLYFHVNEDKAGHAWNTRATIALDGAGREEETALRFPACRLAYASGTRRATMATLETRDAAGRDHRVVWTPQAIFQMKGIGYGHPDWTHGGYKGPLAVAREDFRPDALDAMLVPNLHVQAICTARHEGPDGLASDGIGVLEQLIIGPHAPSGYKDILDPAA